MSKKPLKIVYDARMIKLGQHGIGRYAYCLLQAISELDDENKYLIITNNGGRLLKEVLSKPNFQNLTISTIPFFPSEHVAIPHLLRREKADLFHSPSFLAPLLQPCPTIMTIHDTIPLLFPEGHSMMYPFYYEYSIKPAAKKAAKVLTVSENSKKDIVRLLDVPSANIIVTPNAVGETYHVIFDADALEEVRRKYNLGEHFVLYVGNSQPHKNLIRLLMAFHQLTTQGFPDLELALSIRPNGELTRVIRDLDIRKKIKFLGNVPEQELPALYNASVLFVYPSLYEGFGIPPLEAMACGTPLVTSKTSSLIEVVGDVREGKGAGLLINPYKVEEIALGMREVLTNERLRFLMREKGLRRTKQFSWERTAMRTLRAYEEVSSFRINRRAKSWAQN